MKPISSVIAAAAFASAVNFLPANAAETPHSADRDAMLDQGFDYGAPQANGFISAEGGEKILLDCDDAFTRC